MSCDARPAYRYGRGITTSTLSETDAELERIRDYVRENPVKWAEDRENPEMHAMSRSDKSR